MRVVRSKWLFASLFFFTITCYAQRIGDNQALVIIDMQSYFIEKNGTEKEETNAAKIEEIIKNQTLMIETAKKSNIPIIFIEYKRSGDTHSKLKEAAGNYPDIKYIKKDTDGMFDKKNKHRKELTEYLNAKQIGKLIITGANGGACVYQSISGALTDNYEVVAVSEGIADFNFRSFIYPYNYENRFKCDNCSFKEVKGVKELSFEFLKTKTDSNAEVNDSDRGILKDVSIPSKTETRDSTEAAAQ